VPVATRPANRGEWQPAPVAPIARVVVDVPLTHLDRTFDYRVPQHLDTEAQPGVRIKVRFAGRPVDGFLLERAETTEHVGDLAWVERVVSPEPALAPEIAVLARAVADRGAGMMCDVLRLAVPPRHARVEAEAPRGRAVGPIDPPDPAAGWARYRHGAALLEALRAGRAAHAVWQALPGEDWAARLAEAAAATASAGKGALVVVPDQRDVAALERACATVLGEDAFVALTADLGPAERYRRWLAVRRGTVPVVIGTRAAAFAPVHDLGLVAIWDDGDDSHAEPRAPYPHARDVLVLRAHTGGVAMLVAGHARTAEGQLLVESGWAREVVAERVTVRAAMPRITAIGETSAQEEQDPALRAARLPHPAFEAARAALNAGRPVLVQVPRAGYVPWLACAGCRETARCRHCAGPLKLPARAAADEAVLPSCRWCGRSESAFRCGHCGSRRLRAAVVGSGRTAEELGRAFPGVPVKASGGGVAVLDSAADRAELVVATPGAEPPAPHGYGAALLLDGWALLGRADLRVAEETLRRWMAAAALVVPHAEGGRVVVVAPSDLPVVQALVRWDPVGHAAAELAAREEVGFPPAVRMACVEGPPAAVASLVEHVEQQLGDAVEALGPVEIEPDPKADPRTAPEEPEERVLLRVKRTDGKALATALHTAQAARTARKATDVVRVQLDPPAIG